MKIGLAGKVVVVTGGASNIGRGIILAFAEEGSKIVIADIDEVQARKVQKEAGEAGAEAVLVATTDVTKFEHVEDMVKKALDEYGRIDVLVNNAGGGTIYQPLVDKSLEQMEKEVNLNFWSVVNCIKAVLPRMIEQGNGRIVNIGSDSALLGLPRHAFYAGCKAGIMGISKALAKELGPHGITVNVVSPGAIVPENMEQDIGECSSWHPESGSGQRFLTPEWKASTAKGNPLGRLGKAQDIANAVVFFASEAADYISGQVISVSGGYTTL
ncbi:SDR family NAD(P)-dependent oxidoreductase [Chloroflexota bacterium]